MWRRNRLVWTLLGAVILAYLGRAMLRGDEGRQRQRQAGGVVDLLTKTGRSVANGTMRLVRR